MTAAIQQIDLTLPVDQADQVESLGSYLQLLTAEPFQFSRWSYGDELTLHFGELLNSTSAKRAGKKNGSYILRVRGSLWMLKSAAGRMTLNLLREQIEVPEHAVAVTKDMLEIEPLIKPGSRVLNAVPFKADLTGAYGLQVLTSDGGVFVVLPDHEEEESGEDLPDLADWELFSPHGLLSAGPGPKWSFKPKGKQAG